MGAWDNAPEPEGSGVTFVSLKDGDKFIGRTEKVELCQGLYAVVRAG